MQNSPKGVSLGTWGCDANSLVYQARKEMKNSFEGSGAELRISERYLGFGNLGFWNPDCSGAEGQALKYFSKCQRGRTQTSGKLTAPSCGLIKAPELLWAVEGCLPQVTMEPLDKELWPSPRNAWLWSPDFATYSPFTAFSLSFLLRKMGVLTAVLWGLTDKTHSVVLRIPAPRVSYGF